MLIRNYWKRAIIVYMIYFTVLLVIWVALNLRVEAKLGISKVNISNKVIFNIVTKACKLRKLYLSFSFIRLLYFSKLVFCKYFDRTVGHFYWFSNYPQDESLFSWTMSDDQPLFRPLMQILQFPPSLLP